MTLRVVEPGLLTTVQDLGRHAHQRYGVPGGGAMDPFALRVANLLVGNSEADAGLEITLGGFTARLEADALVAAGGADLRATADGVDLPNWHAARLLAGTSLTFRGGAPGCRGYLAVAGGLAVPQVLGSRSTLLRAGIGGVEGRALRNDDLLRCGSPSPLSERIAAALAGRPGAVVVAHSGVGVSLRPDYSANPTIRLLPGAHVDGLTNQSRQELFRSPFRVSSESDRMGYRLTGVRLELTEPIELLSEAVVFGTVQLPPDGNPIVLMADRPTTGGYPRVGEVATADLPLLAQLRPGDTVRFRPCSLEGAQSELLARERGFELLRQAVALQHPSRT
ncbi:MAG: biotin-dependent carboxyltransferase family protein [Gemmatimonadetes bacterium]|nr:biotin-dependent carboxyltransferase family protein [Gemmatimonadota bacterium]